MWSTVTLVSEPQPVPCNWTVTYFWLNTSEQLVPDSLTGYLRHGRERQRWHCKSLVEALERQNKNALSLWLPLSTGSFLPPFFLFHSQLCGQQPCEPKVPQTELCSWAPPSLEGGVMAESGGRVLQEKLMELPQGSCSVSLRNDWRGGVESAAEGVDWILPEWDPLVRPSRVWNQGGKSFVLSKWVGENWTFC